MTAEAEPDKEVLEPNALTWEAIPAPPDKADPVARASRYPPIRWAASPDDSALCNRCIYDCIVHMSKKKQRQTFTKYSENTYGAAPLERSAM